MAEFDKSLENLKKAVRMNSQMAEESLVKITSTVETQKKMMEGYKRLETKLDKILQLLQQ